MISLQKKVRGTSLYLPVDHGAVVDEQTVLSKIHKSVARHGGSLQSQLRKFLSKSIEQSQHHHHMLGGDVGLGLQGVQEEATRENAAVKKHSVLRGLA